MTIQNILLHDADDISQFLYQATGMVPGYTQFSTGAANLNYQVFEVDGVSLLWAKCQSHCRWQDQMTDDGRLHFAVMLKAENGATSLGHALSSQDAMLFRPGHDMDYVFHGAVETLEIGVSRELVDELGWTFSGPPLARLPGPELEQLVKVCRRASALVTQVGGGGSAAPGLAVARGDILNALEAALTPWLPTQYAASFEFLRSNRYHQVVRKMDKFMGSVNEPFVDLTSVSRALGVGRRSLFYAFRRSMGLTPGRYLELLRLNDLRSRLEKADASRQTVTQIATEMGFGDLGRMAGKYQNQFGEFPKETLRR
ncbi:AraC family transcriptional regulator [Ruegeria sp. Alg231-54]|uniref:AraC family transcriptional regulator n=1 Tax=Ruegeria sp. Alg231-54 TaxID=1922221 RepID=UPI000D552CD7|nr:AraC family transcriptional regulator [Ruegeria sp. Alg231-54]